MDTFTYGSRGTGKTSWLRGAMETAKDFELMSAYIKERMESVMTPEAMAELLGVGPWWLTDEQIILNELRDPKTGLLP